MVKVAVIDGQGGGIGYQIVKQLRERLTEDVELIVLGTNAIATANMMKAHPHRGASGEKAIKYMVNQVDIIVGTVNVVLPNAMMGELTPEIAEAIISSPAVKVLIPMTNQPGLEIINVLGQPLPHHITDLVKRVKELVKERGE